MSEINLLGSVTAFLQRTHGHYINGVSVPGQGNETFSVVNPASGETIATVNQGEEADINQAMQAASDAFHGAWARTSPLERGNCLNRLADLLQENGEELAQLESLCSGKPIQLSRMLEVGASADYLRYFAGWSSKISGETLNVSLPSLKGEKYTAFTRREPIGVVVGIIPWNFSIMIAIWKLGAALASGCTIVLKPSEYTPLIILRVAELAKEAGIPDGVINIINGSGSRVGSALISHPQCSKVTFTGSVPTGMIVGKSALEQGLKHTTLELGGKNAAAFLSDMTVEKIVDGILEAGYVYQGQICAAAERFYIPSIHMDAVLELLSERLSAMKIGSPLDESTEMGPLANKQHYEKILSLFEQARQDGCEIVYGGYALEGAGFFVAPTIVRANSPEDTLMKEETFGPIGTFLSYDDEEELIAMMNSTPFGLSASLWTNDLSKAMRMIPRIESGILWINMHTYLDPSVPFGGMKSSGIGREFGSAFIEHYTELKSVMMRY
ncbi:aldehyde dehydrogenase family protein [Xenorhabdus nematophila]|uniref:aldehyde dehydrogenase family protein n=1 Tax=Xenorhabdus nematophila TaxID=628 RepID=UPI0003275D60|nr:aldehyde dehydrogenase family protein [Xenorhabdus nematophila]CEF28648.1 phenylacetaldehyde dehydrogenase [Xenorhabdus nematophila str. Websteri]AYA39333.1 aldehyde dehydrogenase family protein [Xenorhabdus nematophila]KHD28037.1 aldehyde dehydrogenase [Xenorhabdus nematophila]MBA0017912.1 aldehyde dehydrogenase family protein [Xenorhabdus nematophila]MCB4426412.1 aldehyde dehydrogenase family protein [Xenorhabdus nematophila]